ncbi:hypothetical protein NQ318_009745 [Aromia moschata]|uniref:Uncharacterized protein n=1 Tax=Aromia moschata TaxID=1265417 RepID=A0AAV8Y3L1_9CUCU|nr:hypothetical protein NQ318_009745 [Aromia moschata]
MLHLNHYTPVQQLLPQNLLAHLQSTQFLQNNQTKNPDFRNKIFNWRNNHWWDFENPHAVNIWCGAISNFAIGPFDLRPNLTGPQYLNCLQYHLNELLEDVPLH